MYLTVKQAAALLGASRRTIRRRIAGGAIPAIRLSRGAPRIEPRALSGFLGRRHAE